jgi:hypothetical protein
MRLKSCGCLISLIRNVNAAPAAGPICLTISRGSPTSTGALSSFFMFPVSSPRLQRPLTRVQAGQQYPTASTRMDFVRSGLRLGTDRAASCRTAPSLRSTSTPRANAAQPPARLTRPSEGPLITKPFGAYYHCFPRSAFNNLSMTISARQPSASGASEFGRTGGKL